MRRVLEALQKREVESTCGRALEPGSDRSCWSARADVVERSAGASPAQEPPGRPSPPVGEYLTQEQQCNQTSFSLHQGASAMRQTSARLTIQRLMISVWAIVLSFVLLPPVFTVQLWSGHASIRLEFVILDASTGRLIEGASIRLIEWEPEYEAISGEDGRAKVVVRATTGGRSNIFRDTRSVHYAWGLVVTADCYRGISQALRDVTLGPRYHSDPTPPPILLRLAPL